MKITNRIPGKKMQHKSMPIKSLAKGFCLSLALLIAVNGNAQNLTKETLSTYESQVKKFKPTGALTARNQNDIRTFVYEWFTHFEHASGVDYYLVHLNDKDMNLSFPGQAPLITHIHYAKWYTNLLAQTLWNFHDISKVQVKEINKNEFLVSFIVDWYGEVKTSSDQLSGWQSRKDSYLYHYTLRQTWTVKDNDNKLMIQKLAVTGGDTSSPITENE